MKFDDLFGAWQTGSHQPMPLDQRDELVQQVHRRFQKMQAAIWRRDIVETIAAVAIIPMFCLIGYWFDGTVTKLGAAVVVFGAAYIILKLHGTRRHRAAVRNDVSIRDHLQMQIDWLDRQIRLLRTVLWWYLSPLLIGAILVFVGISGLNVASGVYVVVVACFGWWIYSLNQKAVDDKLLPARNGLSELLQELSDDST